MNCIKVLSCCCCCCLRPPKKNFLIQHNFRCGCCHVLYVSFYFTFKVRNNENASPTWHSLFFSVGRFFGGVHFSFSFTTRETRVRDSSQRRGGGIPGDDDGRWWWPSRYAQRTHIYYYIADAQTDTHTHTERSRHFSLSLTQINGAQLDEIISIRKQPNELISHKVWAPKK